MSDGWLWEPQPVPGVVGGTHDRPVTKVCHHTTQGGSYAGAYGEYVRRKVPPHVTAHPVTRYIRQHVSLDRGSEALHTYDDSGVIQIEWVGYAESAHLWPDSWLRWCAEEVLVPILEYFPGINRYNVGDDQRWTPEQWHRFNGQVGHRNAPAPNNHTDPGELNLVRMLTHARALLEVDEMAGITRQRDPKGPKTYAFWEDNGRQKVYPYRDDQADAGIETLDDMRYIVDYAVTEGHMVKVGPHPVK